MKNKFCKSHKFVKQYDETYDLWSGRGIKQEIKLGVRYIKHLGEEAQKAIVEYLQALQQNINSMISNEKQQ